MTIYTSNLLAKEHRHRGIYSGKEYSVEGIVRIPSGTVLTTADVFKFATIAKSLSSSKLLASVRSREIVNFFRTLEYSSVASI